MIRAGEPLPRRGPARARARASRRASGVVQDVEIPLERTAEFLRLVPARGADRAGLAVPAAGCATTGPAGTSRGRRDARGRSTRCGAARRTSTSASGRPSRSRPGRADGDVNRHDRGGGGRARRPQVPLLRRLLRRGRVLGALRRRRTTTRSKKRYDPDGEVAGPLREGGEAAMTVRARQPDCPDAAAGATVTLGEIFEQLFGADAPVRFSAYDGSTAGRADATIGHPAGQPARRCPTSPPRPARSGWPARTCKGDLEIEGVHPGDPYELLQADRRRPAAATGPPMRAGSGWARRSGRHLRAAAAARSRRSSRRLGCGLRHRRERDASAISYHYDVSNDVLRAGARPVDDLHLRLLPDRGRDAGAGPGAQVRPGRPQARPAARACGCSTSAAAGAAWCGTRRSNYGVPRSA